MPEGTEASVWAHPVPASVPPVRQASKDSATGGKPRGGRGGGGRRSRGGRKQSTAGATQPATDSPSTPAPSQAPAATPTPDAPKSSDPPRKKLIERMTLTPDVPAAAPVAPTAVNTPAQPDSRPAKSRPQKGRSDSHRKGPPAKVNTAPETQQQPAEKEEPKSAGSHEIKDAPPHIGPELAPVPSAVSALVDKVQTLTLPSHPTTPRPYTPSAIDWAVETEDGSLPDLDDWGVHPVKPTSPGDAATNKEESGKADGIANTKSTDLGNGTPAITASATVPPHAETKGNAGRRREPREQGRNNLSVPARNGTNGHSSSRPVTPSSAGFAPSPTLRGKRRLEPARTSRASAVNDPPHITVTPNPNTPTAFNPDDKSQDKSAGGLGLDLSETEPVFASLNDPPLPAPEDPHINPVRAPSLHPQRGARGRGRGRGGGPNHQHHSQLGPRLSGPDPMAVHMPPSPHTPSLHMPPSPYMQPSQFPPNGGYGMQQHGHGGYPMPQHNPYGYTPPSGPGNGNGYGHQHSHSHPQPTQSSHGHQRTHSRPVIANSALSQLTRHLQGAPSPPRTKPDVSASS
ncbi:hypothetical protein BDV93DRAFT_605344 [Ceratobasidium sp. AG-I]|nr:hypothetical protein BDV93DRAFT_605344 [Ceratobasidium sp. AG-I]